MITPEEYFGIVPDVMYNMEQPLGDASAIVFALGCRETAKHTKICYSGEGADEFFGGYNMYRNAERYGENLKNFYVGNTNIMKEDEKQKILKHYDPDVLPIELVRSIYEEMEGLVNGLFACENVNYTPDGKSVLCILQQQEIEHLLG